jgi:hypothetical protein
MICLLVTWAWVGVFTNALPSESAIKAFQFVAFTLAFGHLLPVFVRSHLNPTIFKQFKWRLTIVPIALMVSLLVSKTAFVVAAVVGNFWDVFHSAQQNFGLSRIYDAKAGSSPTTGRALDRMISHVLYVGPIIAGASLVPTLDPLASLQEIGWSWLITAPRIAGEHGSSLRQAVIAISLVAWVVYLVGQWRLSQQGYKVSAHKVALMASTALASTLGWGLSSPLVAFAAMNAFHAVQYFALVWKTEGLKVGTTVGTKTPRTHWVAGFGLVFVIPAIFGAANALVTDGWNPSVALYIGVSLLHFWMDGFIWSVRKKAV